MIVVCDDCKKIIPDASSVRRWYCEDCASRRKQASKKNSNDRRVAVA